MNNNNSLPVSYEKLLCLLVPVLFLFHVVWYYSLLDLNGVILVLVACATFFTSYLAVCFRFDSAKTFLSFAFLFLFVIYCLFRWRLSDFSLSVGDASSYTWDGVFFSEFKKDSGFFPPLTSSIAALGFELFGLEKIASIFVFYAFLTLPLCYIFLASTRFDRKFALITIFLLAFAPLHIWYSKSTFSESIWQVLIVSGMASLALFDIRSARAITFSLLALSLVVFASVFARGTAIFFVLAVVVVIYGLDDFGWRKRLLATTVLVLVFLIGFWIILEIRAPYLIGWQFERVISGVTPSGLIFLISACFFVGVTGLAIIDFRFAEKKQKLFRCLLIAGLAALKIIFCIILHGKNNQSFYDLLILNESLYMRSAFSDFGIALSLGAFFYLMLEGVRHGGGAFIIIVFYFCFSIPLALQSAGVKMEHEVLLYWHRYFFSELFLLVFLAISVFSGKISAWLTSFISHKNNLQFFALCIFFALLLLSQNYMYFKEVQGRSYLSGSADLIEWIKNVSQKYPVYLYLDSNVSYGGYDAPFLLREIRRYGVNVKKLQKSIPLARHPGNVVVICAVDYNCSGSTNGYLVSKYSGAVSWVQHSLNAEIIKEKSIFFNLEAFYSNPKLEPGVVLNISKQIANFLNELGILENGWHSIEDEKIWSSGVSVINLKKKMFSGKWPKKMSLDISPYAAKKDRQVNIEVHVSDQQLNFNFTSDKLSKIEIPVFCKPGDDQCKVKFTVKDAISPKALGESSDTRVLGFALYAISFEGLDN